jgi:hypothetical protein
MTINNPQGMHEYYTATDRHWHAGSESYTGGDSLLTAMRNGWNLLNLAYEHKMELRGGRSVCVYYFQLIRSSERIVMPVVENPFIERLLIERKMMLRTLRDDAVQAEPTHSNSPVSAFVQG